MTSKAALTLAVLVLLFTPVSGAADAPPEPEGNAPARVEVDVVEVEVEEEERARHPILFYLPNRIFDLMDVVRARARVGPGVAVSARATRPVSVTAGFYASVFAGIPGPRGEAKIPWPVGMENYAGADVSVADAGTDAFAPYYGPAEVGAGLQAGLLGFDFGLEPLEALDLVLGFLFIDMRDDDF